MAALVKYADSDNTKDPDSEEDKPEKGKKNGGAKGQHHNQGGHGNNSKRKADNSDLVANTNMQRRKGKPPQHGGGMNLEHLLNQPCPKHGTKEAPSTHLWKDCHMMREFKNSDLYRYDQDPPGGSGPGFHGGGGSSSGFQNNQGHQNNHGNNQQNNQGNQQQLGYQSHPKQLNSGQYHVFTTSLCKRDQKLHKRAVNTVEPAVPHYL